MNKINLYFYIMLILISFAIAFLGVVIMFNFDVTLGTVMAIAGIGLTLRIVHFQ
jgi:uncharacterized membrane protein (DUF485 family)